MRARVGRDGGQCDGVVHDEYLGGVADVGSEVVAPLLRENDDAVGPVEELTYLGAVGVIGILVERGELAVVLVQDYMLARLARHSGEAVLAVKAAAH